MITSLIETGHASASTQIFILCLFFFLFFLFFLGLPVFASHKRCSILSDLDEYAEIRYLEIKILNIKVLNVRLEAK
jgi:hypothetical protein